MAWCTIFYVNDFLQEKFVEVLKQVFSRRQVLVTGISEYCV